MKQKMARYEMHKYWGKKPSKDLLQLIEEYSNEGDIVCDPFAGYGVFVCEAYLNNRNAIGNDLNPSSTFIQKQLLNTNVDLDLYSKEISRILTEHEKMFDYWYSTTCPKCNQSCYIVSTLRSKENIPLMNKVKCECSRSAFEFKLTDGEANKLIQKETSCSEFDHPKSNLIRNGRISVLDNMTTDDLFTTRTLTCHASLLESLNSITDPHARGLARLTFTSNLANCSRLVPPIKSRGPMALGAWMTGFYTGETYLENNVFHYFKNRVSKIIAGKEDYFSLVNRINGASQKGEVQFIDSFDNKSRGYLITNYDTKNLEFPDGSIDYIFTDPPYGDSVPYFEQSALWNTWLGYSPDYKNEVVISDSKLREKRAKHFAQEIALCIKEIYRVLKEDKFFSITFHSISGNEWYALTKACLEAGFSIQDIQWLTQKTFAPRQLNRKKTVKGDVLITFKKTIKKPNLNRMNSEQFENLICEEVTQVLKTKKCNTNDIFIVILRKVFSEHILFEDTNFIEVLSSSFTLDDEGYWS